MFLAGTYVNVTLEASDRQSHGSESPVEVTVQCPSLPCRIFSRTILRGFRLLEGKAECQKQTRWRLQSEDS